MIWYINKFVKTILCDSCTFSNFQDLIPTNYLKDRSRAATLEPQLSGPPKQLSTSNSNDVISIPPATQAVATAAIASHTSGATNAAMPHQPQFTFQDINTQSLAGLAPHININENVIVEIM